MDYHTRRNWEVDNQSLHLQTENHHLMTARNGPDMWVWAAVYFMALTIFVLTVNVFSFDDGDGLNILGGEHLSRDALYLASATLIGFSIFSSVLTFRFEDRPDTIEQRKSASQLMLVGLIVVALLQTILMLLACCVPIVTQSFMYATVACTFIGLVMFGLGLALLIRSKLV